MNTNLLTVVKQIIAEYGEETLENPQHLKAFFSDLVKDEPKPLRIAFGSCIENGAYNALKTAPDADERASHKAAIAQRLRDDVGLDVTLCGEALDILEAAIVTTTPSPPQYQQQQQPVQNNTTRNALIAVAVVAAIIAVVVIVQRTLPTDTELKNTAISVAVSLDSDAFEGFDPKEEIKHYYFIPVTSEEALGVVAMMLIAGEFNYVYSWTTDSGVVKAKNMGYNAELGVVLYRENNRKDGKIIICPTKVTVKKVTY